MRLCEISGLLGRDIVHSKLTSLITAVDGVYDAEVIIKRVLREIVHVPAWKKSNEYEILPFDRNILLSQPIKEDSITTKLNEWPLCTDIIVTTVNLEEG